MSTQDNLERILRQMHVLISKGESFENSKDKVIIKKQDMLDLYSKEQDPDKLQIQSKKLTKKLTKKLAK